MSTRTEVDPLPPSPENGKPVRPPAWWRALARWLSRACLTAAGVLWILDGGAQGLLAADERLGSLGMLSGVLAAALALIQTALMARIPFIERSFEPDELAHRHRVVGIGLVILVVAHIAGVVLHDTPRNIDAFLTDIVNLLVASPSVTLAAVGATLILLVTMTSVRPVRRRLRRWWHRIHLTAYFAVLLSIPHELVFSNALNGSNYAKGLWLTAYVTVFGCALVFRLLRPRWRSWYHQAKVVRVVDEGNDTTSIYVAGTRHALGQFRFQAGHFGIWRLRDGNHKTSSHAFSVSAAPLRNTLRITVKDTNGRHAWLNVPIGTRVHIDGPYGHFTDAVRTRRKVALLGAGTGITPLRALLEGLPDLEHIGDALADDLTTPGVVLLYRASDDSAVLFRRELDDIAARRGAEVEYLIGHRSRGDSWLPEDKQQLSDSNALLQYIPDLADRDVYVCGPPRWMDAVEGAARHAGLPAGQFHRERFSI